MQDLEYRFGDFLISTNRGKLDLLVIHDYLSNSSYWAAGRSIEVVKRSVEGSLCFGVYQSIGTQIGFARVVTDYATFGCVCDVFILEVGRGKGLGKWLIRTIVEHPALKGIKRIMLATKDAHVLYAKYGGFERLREPDRWMERLGVGK
jgi:GNAT superfamily N-acetyltransferase